jgi:nucleoside-diphosphate-sugar epimerase
MNLILGERGEIGSKIAEFFSGAPLKVTSKERVREWITGGEKVIREDFINCAPGDSSIANIFYCVGDTNPHASDTSLSTLNFELPRSILRATVDLPFRLVTFGSVHENSKISNPYMLSKRKFHEFILDQGSNYNWNHFQLHTLYSEVLPKPHMFLGQMLGAIRTNVKFRMSSGNQLRQFHHTSDVVKAVISSIPSLGSNSVIQVAGGNAIRLIDLAAKVFSEIDALENLEVGALGDQENEIYVGSTSALEELIMSEFRNPLIEIPKLVSDVWLRK